MLRLHSGSSLVQHFVHSNMLEMCEGIILNFYMHRTATTMDYHETMCSNKCCLLVFLTFSSMYCTFGYIILHSVQKRWDRGSGWGHLQGDMHMVAVVAGYRNSFVGADWGNSYLGCTNVIRKHYCCLVGALFLAVKAVWDQNGCWLAESADYCKIC